MACGGRRILPEPRAAGPAARGCPARPTLIDSLAQWFRKPAGGFSLERLAREAPGLAAAFLWSENRLPPLPGGAPWLHLGCGDHVLEGFVNLDFLPHDARVSPWDLLDPWPERWPVPAAGAFSEDTLEHFFLAEQLYILCEMNRLLGEGRVMRVLMPSFSRLVDYCRGFRPDPAEFLHGTFAVETQADAVNAGLRFSGHRWLHDDASLAHLAALAGFEAVKTSCAESTEPFLAGRNLRAEEGTAAFAHDLVKRRALERVVVPSWELSGIDVVERLPGGAALGRVCGTGASVDWRLPAPVAVRAIACVNARGANLSSFREHSLKRLRFAGPGGEGAWPLDETLKSRACMNLATPAAVRLALGGRTDQVSSVRLEPGAAGDLVTLGPLEVFYFPG